MANHATEHAARVGADLLALLRVVAGHPQAAFRQEPERVLGGFDTLIYRFELAGVAGSFGRPLILRLFGGDHGAFRAGIESSMQNALADQGYRCPRVVFTGDRTEIAGAHFNLMELVAGEPAIDLALRPPFGGLRLLRPLPSLLAPATARLHEVDVDAFTAAVASPTFDRQLERLSIDAMLSELDRRIDEQHLDELSAARQWLDDRRPPAPVHPVVSHGDLHLGNVMIEGGLVRGVVDWSGVRIGAPEFDIARTVIASLYGPMLTPRLPRCFGTWSPRPRPSWRGPTPR